MLNGLDPVIIFNFKLKPPGVDTITAKIPLVASILNSIDLPAIPIYLSERLTGLYIDNESKSIEIQTETETLSDGKAPDVNQRGISSTVKIEMKAKRDSIGLMLISAMGDLVFPLVTSKLYSITYMHGAITIFQGLLHSFSVSPIDNTDLALISIELIKPGTVAAKTPGPPVVGKSVGTAPGI